MKTPREYFKIAVFAGKIYAMGGYDDAYICSVEAYDPSTNTWTEKVSMPVSKTHFQVEILDGKIYVIGGFSPTETASSMERYDPERNQWSQRASNSLFSYLRVGKLNNHMLNVLQTENRTLDFHVHDNSDELFYCIEGEFDIEFKIALHTYTRVILS